MLDLEIRDHFSPFSQLHIAIVAVFIAVTIGLCVFGRRTPSIRTPLGLAALLIFIGHQVYWFLPANFVWSRSLPLHICDLAGFIAPVALLTRQRWARSLLYFWGLCLCTQGLITPVLTEGPSHAIFWFFFASHMAIIASAIFDLVALRFRPTPRDFLTAVAITFLYIIAMFILNLPTGWNYAYVGNPPTSQPTVINLLGPWPQRVLFLILVGFAAFGVAMLPWSIASKVRRESPPRPSG